MGSFVPHQAFNCLFEKGKEDFTALCPLTVKNELGSKSLALKAMQNWM